MSGKYIHWLVLNDGVAEKVFHDEIDPAEEAAAISRVLIPIRDGDSGHPYPRTSYAVTGEISGKYALLQLHDDGALLADVAVCLSSRVAVSVWKKIYAAVRKDVVAGPYDMPDNPPWCAIICHVDEYMLPPWFDAWTRVTALTLLNREGW